MMNNDEKTYSVVDRLNNLTATLAGVVLAPRRTLTRLISEEKFWVPIIILIIVHVLLLLVMMPETLDHYSSAEFRENYKSVRELDDAQVDHEITLLKKSMPFLVITDGALNVLFSVGGITILLYLIGIVIYKQKARYRPLLALASWTSLISAIPLSLNIMLKITNPEWSLPTSLSDIFSSELVGIYFNHILAIIDIFLIWRISLISIGMSVLYKVSFHSAIRSVGTMFVLAYVMSALLQIVMLSG